MKEIFATQQIAEKLVELGFDQPCITFWNLDDELERTHISIHTGYTKQTMSIYFYAKCVAPIWQQVIDFLRDQYSLDLYIQTDCTVNEIMGYTGHIQALMSYPAEFWEIVNNNIKHNTRHFDTIDHQIYVTEDLMIHLCGTDVEENFNYHKIQEKTINYAIKLIFELENMKKDQHFNALVVEEAIKLKHYAHKDELANLNLETFDPRLPHGCIYGQLTGGCHSVRAKHLLNLCAIPYSGTINKLTTPIETDFHSRRLFVVGHEDTYSALEYAIFNNPSIREKVINFLKSETETLELKGEHTVAAE